MRGDPHFCCQFFDRLATSPPTFLTADELALVLRCQPEKVYRLAARGELPSCKLEGRRLDQGEVATWLEGRRVAAPSPWTVR